jgi:hypothetical protein
MIESENKKVKFDITGMIEEWPIKLNLNLTHSELIDGLATKPSNKICADKWKSRASCLRMNSIVMADMFLCSLPIYVFSLNPSLNVCLRSCFMCQAWGNRHRRRAARLLRNNYS